MDTMKNIMFRIVFIFGFIASTNIVTAANPSTWGKYPGVVAITSSLSTLCVGHIVDSRHVVTSAQCILDKTTLEIPNVFWFKVTAGDIKLFEPTQFRAERNVTNIFPHVLYNPKTNENDIALLRLDKAFDLPHNTIEPVILNSRIVRTSSFCDFVGWKLDKQEQSELQTTTMLVYDRDFCNSQQYPGKIFESSLCAQLQATDDLPNDNFGGGLYCNGELTGLLSVPQTGTSMPSILMQVRFYRNWINKQLQRYDLPEKRLSPLYKKQ